jgi:diguanylate cyclase (GGDEF)-like protein/PAS domain S-box-containing protein
VTAPRIRAIIILYAGITPADIRHYMKTIFTHSLRSRLVLAFATMQILAVLLLGVFIMQQAASTQLEAQRSLARNMMTLAEPNVLGMLTRRDSRGLKNYLDTLIHDTAIAGVFVSDRIGTMIYSLKQQEEGPGLLTRLFVGEEDASIVLESDLLENGISKGMLEIRLSTTPINNRLNTILINNLILLFGLLAVSLIITYRIISGFTAPLKQLVRIAAHLGAGDSLQVPPTTSSDYREISELGDALQESARLMSAQIADLQHTQERLRSNEQQLRTLVNNMREVLFELDDIGNICFLNPAWQQITGYKPDESIGKPFYSLLPEKEHHEMFLPANLRNLDIRNHELEIMAADDKRIRVELDAYATFDEEENLSGIVGHFQDISERYELGKTLREHQEELYRMSITDDLTGLYNRRHFEHLLNEKLSLSLQQDKSICLALLDVDGFKFINDTYGHPVGDKVLKTVANMLRTMMRHNDTVARLAGDEFALLIYDTDINEAKKITEALLESINKTRVRLTVGHLQLRASVGMSVAPIHGQTVQELIGAADVALYHAKRRRRGHVEVLSTDISQGIMEVFSRGFELRNAIEAGDIVPTFQPITELHTGKPMAYEVLANMKRGNLFVPASQFIKVAEDLGLVREIDLHVIGKALQLAPKNVELFMNINLTSFYDENFVHELARLLRPACLEGRQVTIEITERETLAMNDTLFKDIQQLRDLGCKIALDDFGQGYSTYNYLRRFRPEYLKIDGSYIEGILEGGDDLTIIKHIHALSTSFGAISIAESIENEAIRDAVLELGIHCGQGYHYGKPAPADKLFPASASAAS